MKIWSSLFLLMASFFAQAETIFVVESYHAEYLWDQSYKKGLEEVLGKRFDMAYFEMDTKRIPESEYQKKADAAWAMYQQLSPTLVVLADDNALKYLGPKFLNTETPVVYLGINANPRKYGVTNAPNFSGVIERPLLIRSIIMLRKFLPLKKVLLLLDSKETSKVVKEDIFYGNDSIVLSGIHIDIKLVEKYSQWQKYVLAASEQGYDVLIPALYHGLVDDTGAHASPSEVIEWTSQNTAIPPFGFWDFSVGESKSIGGYVVFGYEEGKLAGEIALSMLAGEKMHVRPQNEGQGQFIFSKAQLEKWKIDLPPDIREQTLFVD